jgi:hypothetical protein
MPWKRKSSEPPVIYEELGSFAFAVDIEEFASSQLRGDLYHDFFGRVGDRWVSIPRTEILQ